MATSSTATTTLLEHLSEQQYHHHEFFLPSRTSRRSSSRRSSGGSESSRSSIASTVSYTSTTSSDSSASNDGIVKGLTILGVCLVYAFALFFIASLTTALSYIFRFGKKGAKTPVKVSSSIKKVPPQKINNALPVHKQG